MKSFFSWDGPLLRTFDRIGKLILLSFLWMICSIPVVTMGYASVALYYTTVKTIRCDRGYVIPEFFGCLKREWKQGLICSVIHMLSLLLFSLDAYVWFTAKTKQGMVLAVVCAAFTALSLLLGVYLYALISRFECSVKELFKMAAFLEFKYLHVTVGIALVLLASAGCLYLTYWFCLFIPGTATLIISYMVEKIFSKLIPAPEDGESKWYDEEQKEEHDAYEESN